MSFVYGLMYLMKIIISKNFFMKAEVQNFENKLKPIEIKKMPIKIIEETKSNFEKEKVEIPITKPQQVCI